MKRLIGKIFRKIKAWEEKDRLSQLRRTYLIPDSFRFNGNDILIYGKGSLEIGENSYIGSLSTIQLQEGNKVKIGDGCSISHNVRIYTSSKDPNFDFKYKDSATMKCGDVIIENYAWIGANVFINPGITIGENSVIGANSVVTKNIEPNSINGGVPAKIIKMKTFNNEQLWNG